jgi:hypothetical protein
MTAQSHKPEQANQTPGHEEFQVTVEDGEGVVHKSIASGATPVAVLLAELGLDGDLVLWLKRHGRRSLIDVHAPFTPENGDRFIAVRGGGVS